MDVEETDDKDVNDELKDDLEQLLESEESLAFERGGEGEGEGGGDMTSDKVAVGIGPKMA